MIPTRSVRGLRSAALLIVALAAANALALPLPTYPTTAPGPSSTDWYPDRYAPAGFANAGTLYGRGNVLAISLAAADGPGVRPPPFDGNFYNTQGRKIDVDAAAPASWVASLYVPSSWATPDPSGPTLTRRSDLWATLHDGGGAGVYYPIVGFTNEAVANWFGGTPRYRVWNGAGWTDLAQPVAYDAWTDFCVTWTGTALEYRIGNTLVYTDNNAGIAGAVLVGDVMLQAYNFGSAYSANWSQVAAGPGTCAEQRAPFAPPPPATPPQPVPVGPLAPLAAALAVALAALSRLARRR